MLLIEDLVNTTCELQRLVMARIRKTAYFRGCTLLQFQVLLYISEHAQVTNSDLAANFDITPAAVTQLTERLESASFISRVPDTTDRRIQFFTLTSEGQRQLHDFLTRRNNELKAIFSTLNSEDQQQLLRLHHMLVERINRRNDEVLA